VGHLPPVNDPFLDHEDFCPLRRGKSLRDHRDPTHGGRPGQLPAVQHDSSGPSWASYVSFIDTSATFFDNEAFQAPDTSGVQFHNIFCLWIAGSGGDKSLINGTGGPCTSTNPGTVKPVDLTSYP